MSLENPIARALNALRPGAQWSIVNGDLATLQWLEPEGGQSRPSDEEILAARDQGANSILALTPAQAHKGLADRNLLQPFYAWLATLPFSTRKGFEFADWHEREGSTLTAGLAHPSVAGMSADQLDQFFAFYGAAVAPTGPMPTDPGVHIAWLELALLELGKLEAVEDAVAQDPRTASLWRRATTLRKTDPEVVTIASLLAIDRDALFARADELRRARGS